jgi:hypothetical protein
MTAALAAPLAVPAHYRSGWVRRMHHGKPYLFKMGLPIEDPRGPFKSWEAALAELVKIEGGVG